MDVLLSALGGTRHAARVSDPLGRPVAQATFALLPDGHTAIVETAQACGLGLVPGPRSRPVGSFDPGNGTADRRGGRGRRPARARDRGRLGYERRRRGRLEALEEAGVRAELDVLCDVRTPFEQAASVFGPQKGADAAMVRRLDRRLKRLAEALPRDPRGRPMTGAAGGLAGGSGRGARLGFDRGRPRARRPRLRRADPRRGLRRHRGGATRRADPAGKIVAEVATRCRQAGVACHAVVGQDALDPFEQRILDLASVTQAGTLEELEAAGRALVAT